MTDTEVVANEAAAQADPAPFIAEVELKSGCGTITVNFDEMNIDMYKMLLIEGAKAVLNSVGMSKKLPGITKLEGADKEKAIEAVRKQAEETLAKLMNGTLSKGRGKSKVSGAVQTEALRLAKLLVKQHIKDSGQKVGAYSAKEITAAAKAVLDANPALVQQAEKNLAERAGDVKGTKGLDLKKLFGA